VQRRQSGPFSRSDTSSVTLRSVRLAAHTLHVPGPRSVYSIQQTCLYVLPPTRCAPLHHTMRWTSRGTVFKTCRGGLAYPFLFGPSRLHMKHHTPSMGVKALRLFRRAGYQVGGLCVCACVLMCAWLWHHFEWHGIHGQVGWESGARCGAWSAATAVPGCAVCVHRGRCAGRSTRGTVDCIRCCLWCFVGVKDHLNDET
jgi:hypothetical protein